MKNERTKKNRQVIGLHSCREVIRVRPKAIAEVWIKDNYESSRDHKELADKLQSLRIPFQKKPISALDRIASGHQGLCLFVKETPEFDWQKIAQKQGPQIILILDGLEDPHNLGAILRTSWLIGVSAIIIPQDRSVSLTPTVHKVASGGAEHVPILETTDFNGVVEKLKEIGFWVYGLSAQGNQPLYDVELSEKVVIVVGSEESGMRKGTERLCDELVSIPQTAADSSYNASVAVAIALSESYRQIHKDRKNK